MLVLKECSGSLESEGVGSINSLDVIVYLHHEPEIQDGQAAIRGADEVAWVRICHQPAWTVQQHSKHPVRIAHCQPALPRMKVYQMHRDVAPMP